MQSKQDGQSGRECFDCGRETGQGHAPGCVTGQVEAIAAAVGGLATRLEELAAGGDRRLDEIGAAVARLEAGRPSFVVHSGAVGEGASLIIPESVARGLDVVPSGGIDHDDAAALRRMAESGSGLASNASAGRIAWTKQQDPASWDARVSGKAPAVQPVHPRPDTFIRSRCSECHGVGASADTVDHDPECKMARRQADQRMIGERKRATAFLNDGLDASRESSRRGGRKWWRLRLW